MTTTIRDLAAELDVPEVDVETYVSQLVDVDGKDETIATQTPILNGSGRSVGIETTLTDSAADFLREMHAAGKWNVE